MKSTHAHYGRILMTFFKNSLIREMSFRGHFFVQVASELLWVVGILIFIEVIFSNTPDVSGWSERQYLVLIGTHMLITSLFETFFFSNCWRISELVRTGNLDFVLVRPANAQFLLSLERVEYSGLANVPVAIGLTAYGVAGTEYVVGLSEVFLYALLVIAGVMILYSLLFMFAITSIWLIRQTGVDHLWFYAVSLARYPAEIYKPFMRGVLFFVLVYILPVLMVSNLPARVMVRAVDPFLVAYIGIAALALLGMSTVVFRLALKGYRSASS